MWKHRVEAILTEAIMKIRAIDDDDPATASLLAAAPPLKCEATIAKGKRENQRCNSRVQPGSSRCKTHSKGAKVAAIEGAEPADKPASTLVSALDGETCFATRDPDGTIVFNVRTQTPEQLF